MVDVEEEAVDVEAAAAAFRAEAEAADEAEEVEAVAATSRGEAEVEAAAFRGRRAVAVAGTSLGRRVVEEAAILDRREVAGIFPVPLVAGAVRVRHNCHPAAGACHRRPHNAPEGAEIVHHSVAAHRNCHREIVLAQAAETAHQPSRAAPVARIGQAQARETARRNCHPTGPAQVAGSRIVPVQNPASVQAQATSGIFSASLAEPLLEVRLAVRWQAVWEIVRDNCPPIGPALAIARALEGLVNDTPGPSSARTGMNARKTETSSGSSV